MAITIEMQPEIEITGTQEAGQVTVETPKKKRGRPRKEKADPKTDAAAAEQTAINNVSDSTAPVAAGSAPSGSAGQTSAPTTGVAVPADSPEDLQVDLPSSVPILAQINVVCQAGQWTAGVYTGMYDSPERVYLRNDETFLMIDPLSDAAARGTNRAHAVVNAADLILRHWEDAEAAGLAVYSDVLEYGASHVKFVSQIYGNAIDTTASDTPAETEQAAEPEASQTELEPAAEQPASEQVVAEQPADAAPAAAIPEAAPAPSPIERARHIVMSVEAHRPTQAEIAEANKKRSLHRSIWETERELLSLDIEEAKAAAALKAITKERKEVRDRLLELRERLEDPQMEIEFSNDGSWSRTVSDYQPSYVDGTNQTCEKFAETAGESIATAVIAAPAQPAPAADPAGDYPPFDAGAATPLEQLKISPGRIEKLADAEITTVGQLEIAISTGKLQFVKGIGDKAVDAITDALMDFRRENPVPSNDGPVTSRNETPAVGEPASEQPAIAAHGQPAADSGVATEDAEKTPELPRDQPAANPAAVALAAIDLPEDLVTDNPGDNALRLRIYRAGCEAAISGKLMKSNPHERGTRAWAIWDKGWRDITDASGPDDDSDNDDMNPQVDPVDDLGDDIPGSEIVDDGTDDD